MDPIQRRWAAMQACEWPAALSALSGLDTVLPKLAAYVAHARVVAAALAELPVARVHPNPPHTHQFQLWLPHRAEALEQATLSLADQEKIWFAGGWRDQPPTGPAMAEVTILEPGLQWSADDIRSIGTRFIDRVSP